MKKLNFVLVFFSLLAILAYLIAKDENIHLDPNSTKQSQHQQETVTQPKAAATPKRVPQAVQSVIEDFNSKYGGKWTGNFNEDGSLRSLMGGNVPNIGRSRERLKRWSMELADSLGIKESKLELKNETTESQFAKHYYLLQSHQGYDVHQGIMQVSVRKDDGSVFQINSSLKPLPQQDWVISLSEPEAWKVVQSKYSTAQVDYHKGKPTKPVIYSFGGTTELAWVYSIHMETPELDYRQLVVGMSGKILEDQKLLQH